MCEFLHTHTAVDHGKIFLWDNNIPHTYSTVVGASMRSASSTRILTGCHRDRKDLPADQPTWHLCIGQDCQFSSSKPSDQATRHGSVDSILHSPFGCLGVIFTCFWVVMVKRFYFRLLLTSCREYSRRETLWPDALTGRSAVSSWSCWRALLFWVCYWWRPHQRLHRSFGRVGLCSTHSQGLFLDSSAF